MRWTEAAVIAALQDWARRYGEVPTAVDWDQAMARRLSKPAKVSRLDEHPVPIPSVYTVVARFGTWKAAVVASGLQPRGATPQRQRLDEIERERTLALYESGLSTLQVAERLGVSPKTVRDRLHSAGVVLRPKRPRSRPVPDPEREAAVLAAAREGVTQREIADRLGISSHEIGETLKRGRVSGGPLVRRVREQLPRLDEGTVSERELQVIDLVVRQRRTRGEAAARLGISASTVGADLRRVATVLGVGSSDEN